MEGLGEGAGDLDQMQPALEGVLIHVEVSLQYRNMWHSAEQG